MGCSKNIHVTCVRWIWCLRGWNLLGLKRKLAWKGKQFVEQCRGWVEYRWMVWSLCSVVRFSLNFSETRSTLRRFPDFIWLPFFFEPSLRHRNLFSSNLFSEDSVLYNFILILRVLWCVVYCFTCMGKLF